MRAMGHSFGFALARMKVGQRYRRAGWPSETWVTIASGCEATVVIDGEERALPVAPFLIMHSSAKRMMPFTPSHTDLTAEDWEPHGGEEA